MSDGAGPSWRARPAELLPFGIAAIYLLYTGITRETPYNDWTVWSVGLELLVPLGLLLTGHWRGIWRAPCLLAPLAVLHPWAVMPSHMGIGFGWLPSFLGWSTRYPSVGPFNAEVVAGMLCVLGASAMPVLHARASRHVGPAALTALFALALVPWVPVLVRLDLELVAMAYLGVFSLFNPEPTPFWPVAVGPAMRLLAVLGMAAGTAGAWWRRWRAA